MTAGRSVPLRWVLLAVFVPVVAGTGLAISSLMAQRMRAFALDSTQAELKTEVAVIRKRWERIVDPERTLTHLEVIDGLVAAIPNPGVDVHRKVLIESAQLFDEASHLASVNVLKTDGGLVAAVGPVEPRQSSAASFDRCGPGWPPETGVVENRSAPRAGSTADTRATDADRRCDRDVRSTGRAPGAARSAQAERSLTPSAA